MTKEKALQTVDILLSHCSGSIVDGTITYLTECGDGYDDHDAPVIAAYENCDSEDPFFECSINDMIDGADVIDNGEHQFIRICTCGYGITDIIPLVPVKEVFGEGN